MIDYICDKKPIYTLLQFFIEYISVVVAFIVASVCFKTHTVFFRPLYFQLTTWFFVLPMLYLITIYQKNHGQEENNLILVNLNMVVEFLLIAWAVQAHYKQKRTTLLVWILFLVFILVCSLDFKRAGVHYFFKDGFVFGALCIGLVMISVVYKDLKGLTSSWWKSPTL